MKIKNLTREFNSLVSIARTVNLKKAAIPFYDILPSWCFSEHQLRFKAYCVGTGKSGTTSMYAIFHNQYRSAHEPEMRFLVPKIRAFVNGNIDQKRFTRYIKHQDRRLGLEMNSSNLNYYLIDILVNEFSDAKFILTIRDCYSWLESTFSQQLFIFEIENWLNHYMIDFMNLRFGGRTEHAKEEAILAEKGLYTLDGYLSYWRKHNNKILATVPEERLLVVKTREIDQSIERIEEFLGIPPNTLPRQVRENVRRKKFNKLNILSQIDKDFLEEKVNYHCKELMDRYFPEVKEFNFLK